LQQVVCPQVDGDGERAGERFIFSENCGGTKALPAFLQVASKPGTKLIAMFPLYVSLVASLSAFACRLSVMFLGMCM
jgi:hypothetical protein